MKIIQLVTGTHTTVSTSFGVMLPGHTGAVTLLQHEGQNVLVDTGGRGMYQALKIKLQEHGLIPGDINMVILTHFHLDHAFNICRFSKARIFGWTHEWRDRETLRIKEMDGFRLLDKITLVKTPGHAEEHLSVVAEADDGTSVVIAGDAINEEYALTGQVKSFTYDETLYRQNADRLLRIADMIIPGHGRQFYPG